MVEGSSWIGIHILKQMSVIIRIAHRTWGSPMGIVHIPAPPLMRKLGCGVELVFHSDGISGWLLSGTDVETVAQIHRHVVGTCAAGLLD